MGPNCKGRNILKIFMSFRIIFKVFKIFWLDHFRCVCPPGFTGPRCQVTGISFQEKGYALFSPLEQCENSRTSLEFITQQDGLLFYNGPVINKPVNSERDYILLELINGYPQLSIDHGTGELILTLNGKDKSNNLIINKVNDGKWHRVDIIRNKQVSFFVVAVCLFLKGTAVREITVKQ